MARANCAFLEIHAVHGQRVDTKTARVGRGGVPEAARQEPKRRFDLAALPDGHQYPPTGKPIWNPPTVCH